MLYFSSSAVCFVRVPSTLRERDFSYYATHIHWVISVHSVISQPHIYFTYRERVCVSFSNHSSFHSSFLYMTTLAGFLVAWFLPFFNLIFKHLSFTTTCPTFLVGSLASALDAYFQSWSICLLFPLEPSQTPASPSTSIKPLGWLSPSLRDAIASLGMFIYGVESSFLNLLISFLWYLKSTLVHDNNFRAW